jgi:hypothetical protein
MNIIYTILIDLIDCIQSIRWRPLVTQGIIRRDVTYFILKNIIDFSLIMSIPFMLIKLLVLIILKLIELHLKPLVIDSRMMII